MNWKDITLEQAEAIEEALKIADDLEKTIELISIVYGEDTLNLPATDIPKYAKELEFLKNPVPHIPLKKNYLINGKEYELKADVTKITSAQFIDYNSFLKEKKINKILAVFFIPKGHNYNEGYEIEEVFTDMLQLPMPDVQAATFFFKRQLLAFMTLFQIYSIKAIKKNKNLTKKEKMELIARIKMNNLMGSFLVY